MIAENSNKEFVYANDIISIFIDKGFKMVSNPIISNNIIDAGLPYKLRVMSICFLKPLND